MASTKFEVSMEIFKFQGEPDVSVTLTGKSPTELDTALKTLETIAKTTTLYDGDSAPEAEKSVTSEPKQAAPVVSTAGKKAPQEAGKPAYARLRRCVQDALKEDLRVTDTDDRKGMLSTPGRGPSVYETAAVYSEIFRRARAARAVAPLAVYSAAKYDETMTAARKRASVMLGL